jgi:hypothetical protein
LPQGAIAVEIMIEEFEYLMQSKGNFAPSMQDVVGSELSRSGRAE